MSSRDLAVSARGLSKAYTIAHNSTRLTTAGEALMSKLKNPFVQVEKETFWALRDVSFDIPQGEVVGIIGRNGAGKSTLLKILSRITDPTQGEVHIFGRVGSLLEVGTGFHQELTGRENIYLNGAILGMKKQEINRHFDDIVEFSGVDKFLDTPVKRYSSGMYVRLAFSVAAHLNPEILIVDEVLAVGDSEFQKKCIGKMQDVSSNQGKTVLFVSHNLSSIKMLCDSLIMLHKGSVKAVGEVEKVLTQYMSESIGMNGYWERPIEKLETPVYFEKLKVLNERMELTDAINFNERFFIKINVNSREDIANSQIAMRVTNQEGISVLTTTNTDESLKLKVLKRGTHEYVVEFPARLFMPGMYSLTTAIIEPNVKSYDLVENEVAFSIGDAGSYKTELRDGREGVISPLLIWEEA